MKVWLVSFLIVTLIISGCASSGKKASEPELDSSLADEVSVGEKIHAEILNSFYVYTDPGVVSYVKDINRELTSHAERQDLPYQVTVLYNDKIYATSAPGGYIYITTGMMNFLESEAQFAAVLAHEIGQLQYRDPRLSQFRKMLGTITQTGATIGPAFGQLGALAVLGLVMVNALVDTKEKTPQERVQKSDQLALEYLLSAGYDPQGMADVLLKFLTADVSVIPYFYEYYQARPVSQERLDSLRESFSQLPLDDKDLTTKPQLYQQMTKGIRQIYQR